MTERQQELAGKLSGGSRVFDRTGLLITLALASNLLLYGVMLWSSKEFSQTRSVWQGQQTQRGKLETEIQERIDALTNSLQALQTQENQARAKADAATKAARAQAQQVTALQGQLKDLVREQEEARSAAIQAKQERAQAEADAATARALQQSVETLKATHASVTEEIKTLTQQRDALAVDGKTRSEQVKALEAKARGLFDQEARAAQMTAREKELNENISALAGRKKGLDSQIAERTRDLSSLTSQTVTMELQLRDQRQEGTRLAALRAERERTELALAQSQSKLKAMESDLAAQQALVSQIYAQQQQLAQAQNNLRGIQAQLAKQKAESQAAKSELASAQTALTSRRSELASAEQRLTSYTAQLATSSSELLAKNRQKQEVEAARQQAEGALAALEKTIAERRRELGALLEQRRIVSIENLTSSTELLRNGGKAR